MSFTFCKSNADKSSVGVPSDLGNAALLQTVSHLTRRICTNDSAAREGLLGPIRATERECTRPSSDMLDMAGPKGTPGLKSQGKFKNDNRLEVGLPSDPRSCPKTFSTFPSPKVCF
jgi:hypothetical protein